MTASYPGTPVLPVSRKYDSLNFYNLPFRLVHDLETGSNVRTRSIVSFIACRHHSGVVETMRTMVDKMNDEQKNV